MSTDQEVQKRAQYFSVFGKESAGVGRAWGVAGNEAIGFART